jgi:hypothetical protein
MKNYQVTAWRKGDRTAKVSVIRDTETEVAEWVANHRAEENNAHAYQIMTRYYTAGEWQITTGYYLVNGQEINERQFIDIMYERVRG